MASADATAHADASTRNQASELQRLIADLDVLAFGEPAALQAHQVSRLQTLHTHFQRHSAWYQDRRVRVGLGPNDGLDLNTLIRMTPITRADLQRQGEAAFATPPAEHGAVQITQTSGSSGEPVRVARTALSHQYWMAYGLREHRWFQRDVTQSLFVVRANLPKRFIAQDSWGPPVSLLAQTGPGYAASLSLSTAELAGLVAELKPAYLLLYPSVLHDLLRQFKTRGDQPSGLLQVRSMGETLPPDLRQAVQDAWGVNTVDAYSSQELGVIAIQCPDGEGYHLMAENLLVEVLHPDGQPCAAGEVGQLVITDLHNHATPLIRYAIGDWAEAGGTCRCGCRLPMIRSVKGRMRNLITYPNGERRWPLLGFAKFRDIAPIAQYQVVQRAIDLIELRLVCPALSPKQEQALKAVMSTALGHAFPTNIVYHPGGLPRQANGKHEEVISLVEV